MEAKGTAPGETMVLSDIEVHRVDTTGDCVAMEHITPEMERRVRAKIDMVVMPLMAIFFLFAVYASVFGLITDLHLHGTQYSWTSGIFYVGQIISEFPFIYLMSRLPLAKFVGVTVIVWGCICMCLAAATTFRSFLGVRFVLVMAEGAVSPAFVTLTSIWYKRSEHPMRIGIWVSCNGLAQVVGALMMYGIGKRDTSIAAWKIMFLVCGALTVVLGVIFFFLMPSGPETAWFLTAEEIAVAKRRLQLESEAGDKENFDLRQIKEALLDLRTWLTLAMGTLLVLVSPVIVFASLIISSYGYNKFQTMLYTSPSGAIQICGIWLGILLCQIFPRNRCAILIGLVAIPFTGVILLLTLPLSAGWGVVVSSWLAFVISNLLTIALSLSASNVRGNTKKAMVNAFYFIGYSLAGIVVPNAWSTDTAPRYRKGLILALVSWIVFIGTVLVYWYSCLRDNKTRSNSTEATSIVLQEGREVTDKEDKSFKYQH